LLAERYTGVKDNEIDLLMRLISDKNREIEELKQCVESNPLLAERHAKVLDLELQLKQFKETAMQVSVDDKLMALLDRTLRVHESHLSDI